MLEHQTLETVEASPRRGEALASLVERLAAIAPGRFHILSCYLRLEPRNRTRKAYFTELKTRIKALAADPAMVALPREDRLAVERDVARILEAVEHPANLPHSRGLALFACEALGLFEAAPLPRVHRTRLILDDTPWIRELVAAEQESGALIAVLLDRTHARLFEVDAAGATELPCLVGMAGRGGKFRGDREDSPGWGERRYHDRIEEERHRHYADIVREVEHLVSRRSIRGIVLAGPADHTSALARFLPSPLAGRLLGTAKLNPTAAAASEVQAASFAAAEEHDRVAAAGLVSALGDSRGTGWTVNGPRDTLRALARGQVRTLLVREDLEGGGFRCGTTGRLVLSKGECRGEGEPAPVRDLVDEAVEEALGQRVEVVVLRDPAVAKAVNGLAAFLRFK